MNIKAATIGKLKLYIERKLNRRERLVVYSAAGILLALLLFQLLVAPIFAKHKRMRTAVTGRMATLNEIRILTKEYEALRQETERSSQLVAMREKGFTLFSFLDKLAGAAGVKDNISYMKPSESASPNSQLKKSIVEMELRNISLEQLTNFLYGVETAGKLVNVKRLSITKKDKQDAALVVVMQVETFES
ncbi:MAG: type II secretion system protein GspM [Thermodesulfobacteriota bacterium]